MNVQDNFPYAGLAQFYNSADAYIVPSNSIEIIDPETRESHIGNDHGGVYIKALGIDLGEYDLFIPKVG